MSKGNKTKARQNVRHETSADDLRLLREYRNRMQKAWWAKQSPEERRERRQRYDINRARKLMKQLESEEI